MQHPSYWFFNEAIRDVINETGAEPGLLDSVHLPTGKGKDDPPFLGFPLTTKLNTDTEKMTSTNWAKVLSQQTCLATASILPWTPAQAAKWEASCKSQFNFNPASSTKVPPKEAFELLPLEIKQTLVEPVFPLPTSSGIWRRELFGEWNDVLNADRARVSILHLLAFASIPCT